MNLSLDEIRIIRSIARYFSSKWKLIEIDDLTSELTLWAYSHYKIVDEWRSDSRGEGKLYVTLKREAAKYCAKETQKTSIRPIDAENYYTIDQLIKILPFLWEIAPESPSSTRLPEETNLAVTIVADVRSSFYSLNKEDRSLLEIRYRLELSQSEIGELIGLSDRGAEKRIQRALRRLHDNLGGNPPII
jgi:RNA polymerase sigma factor (sigma-70 family)